MFTLLVVEDDPTIGSTLTSALRANGHRVVWEKEGGAALRSVDRTVPDLVLLDLGLPDMEGLVVCRELRALLPSAVIVILTSRHDQLDVVSGLESGADDYLTKPFGLVEILARVRAHLRRHAGDGAAEKIVVGALTVDLAARRAFVAGREMELRAREFDLLARLARSPGVAARREELMSDVWDSNWFGSTKTLDVHVASLRHRLAVAAADSESAMPPPRITTLRGHGYRLDP